MYKCRSAAKVRCQNQNISDSTSIKVSIRAKMRVLVIFIKIVLSSPWSGVKQPLSVSPSLVIHSVQIQVNSSIDDGCCNNLQNPSQGMPSTAFQRLLPSDYSDGVSLPRGGLTSSSLPSARAVSVAVHQAHEETNHKESISQMIMQFGQGGAIINFIIFDQN